MARPGDIARLAALIPVNWNGSALIIPCPGIEDLKGKAFYRLPFYSSYVNKACSAPLNRGEARVQ
jgi:hypothetical protein